MAETNWNTSKGELKHLSEMQRDRVQEVENRWFNRKWLKHLLLINLQFQLDLKCEPPIQITSYLKYYDVYLSDVGTHVKRPQSNEWKELWRKVFRLLNQKITECHYFDKQKRRIHSVDSFIHKYCKTHTNEHIPCTKTVCSLINKGGVICS